MAPPKKITDELVETVAHLLSRGHPKGSIKRVIAERVGGRMHPSSVEKVLRLARDMIATGPASETTDYLRAESLEFYRSVTRNPKASERDRIAARVQIDRLLGLEMPPAPPSVAPLPTEVRIVVAGDAPDG